MSYIKYVYIFCQYKDIAYCTTIILVLYGLCFPGVWSPDSVCEWMARLGFGLICPWTQTNQPPGEKKYQILKVVLKEMVKIFLEKKGPEHIAFDMILSYLCEIIKYSYLDQNQGKSRISLVRDQCYTETVQSQVIQQEISAEGSPVNAVTSAWASLSCETSERVFECIHT